MMSTTCAAMMSLMQFRVAAQACRSKNLDGGHAGRKSSDTASLGLSQSRDPRKMVGFHIWFALNNYPKGCPRKQTHPYCHCLVRSAVRPFGRFSLRLEIRAFAGCPESRLRRFPARSSKSKHGDIGLKVPSAWV